MAIESDQQGFQAPYAACRADPKDSSRFEHQPHVFLLCWQLRWQGRTSISPAVSLHIIHPSTTHFFFVIAPDDDIQGPMREYFNMGVSDVQMGELLKAHYDANTYGIRYLTMAFLEY